MRTAKIRSFKATLSHGVGKTFFFSGIKFIHFYDPSFFVCVGHKLHAVSTTIAHYRDDDDDDGVSFPFADIEQKENGSGRMQISLSFSDRNSCLAFSEEQRSFDWPSLLACLPHSLSRFLRDFCFLHNAEFNQFLGNPHAKVANAKASRLNAEAAITSFGQPRPDENRNSTNFLFQSERKRKETHA
jgi:hypothetical protein